MGKVVHNNVLDAALNYIKSSVTRIAVNTTEPATYTAATSGATCLAIKTITTTDFTGPADGDTNGRKLTVNSAATVAVNTTGTASHVSLSDATASALLYITTCSAQALTSGNTVTVPAWDIEIADPT
jgi:uncharacterized protein YabE (DUF348 family)